MSGAIPNPAAGVYSFLDVVATLVYPGGSTTFTATASVGGLGFSEEGIRITRVADKNAMVVGADGSVMHSLRATRAAKITISLWKTSPGNALLSQIYNQQSVASSLWGQNQLTINNTATGDNITAIYGAFTKQPDNLNRAEGGVMDWEFDFGYVDEILGNGFQSTGLLVAAAS